ncbi:hypothetical protein K502DRAFT_346113 [Neoconidiobolus thromboides FSU 785]|nr:hypothetical protein K502DRAFT_346113 [Neoconidiobolus thromboides FSU 785]
MSSILSNKTGKNSYTTSTKLTINTRGSTSYPSTLLIRDSKISTLNELKELLLTEKHQKLEESKEISRLLLQLKALKVSLREFYIYQDLIEVLHDLIKKEEDTSSFYAFYKEVFQNLQFKLVDQRLCDPTLKLCLLDELSQKNNVLIQQFITFIRSHSDIIAPYFTNLCSDKLFDLVKPRVPFESASTIPDIFLYGLFDSPLFEQEYFQRMNLWKTIIISLIKERKGEQFIMGILERYLKVHNWTSKGSLELVLLKVLNQGEEILKLYPEEELSRTNISGRRRSQSFSQNMFTMHQSANSHFSTPYNQPNPAEVDKFLDSACFELLSILDQYIPPCLIHLNHAILSELPSQFHYYASIQVMLKFFFYRFFGKVICYPELFGMCEDYYISERRRQKILYQIHQRLYRYITTVTSAVPGWRSLNVDPRIRNLVEKVVGLFSVPSNNDQVLPDLPSFIYNAFTPIESSPTPSPTSSTLFPTILVTSQDIIELHTFFSVELKSKSETSRNSLSSLENYFKSILGKLKPLVSDLKEVKTNHSVLFKVSYSSSFKKGTEYGDATITPFHKLDFMMPCSVNQNESEPSSDVHNVSTSLIKAITMYENGSARFYSKGTVFTNHGEGGIDETLKMASLSSRFYGRINESVSFQNARNLLLTIPEEYSRDNFSGLIRNISSTFESNRSVRDSYSKQRQVWMSFTQEFERRIRAATINCEAKVSSLRLFVFYTQFRLTKVYGKHRDHIGEIAFGSPLEDYQKNEVEDYLIKSRIHDFIPGDTRFQYYCLKIQALSQIVLSNIWCSDGYTQESFLFDKNLDTLSHSNHSSSHLSGISSLRLTHVTHPSNDSLDLFQDEAIDKRMHQAYAFANTSDCNFPSIMRLRIIALILSEFSSAFKPGYTDKWFNELVTEFEPLDHDIELKSNEGPYLSLYSSLLYPPIKGNQASFINSPRISLSSCSQSPVSDSSTSANSTSFSNALSPPLSVSSIYSSNADYNTLCTQITLYSSPLKKLHMFFALELLVVANITSSESPGTDSIVNELERIFRRTRPKYLFRDLQLISLFVPGSILDLSDEGKAYWDMTMAAMSVKKEVVDRIVTKGTILLDSMSKRPTNNEPKSNEHNDQCEQKQQMEALRLFTIAAKESHVVAQRELGILYLSLPSVPKEYKGFLGDNEVDFPKQNIQSPTLASSFLSSFYRVTNNSSSTKVTNGADKFDPANVAAALHWFGKAAKQGDSFSLQYLTHRDGAERLPSISEDREYRRPLSRSKTSTTNMRRSHSSAPKAADISVGSKNITDSKSNTKAQLMNPQHNLSA